MKKVTRESDGKFTRNGRYAQRKADPRVVPRTKRLEVLEFLVAHGGDQQLACREFKLPARSVQKIVKWDALASKRTNPFRARAIAEVNIRTRLYEQSVATLERFSDPIEKVMEEFVETSAIAKPEEHLSTFMAARGKQADTAVKVLYGLPEALKAQGETKHTGTIEHEHRMAILVGKLAEGRKRIAELSSGTDGS